MTEFNKRQSSMSAEAFAEFGDCKVAYVREVHCEDAVFLFPEIPYFIPDLTLFALHAANGTLIAVTDSREKAIKDAATRQLMAVSLH